MAHFRFVKVQIAGYRASLRFFYYRFIMFIVNHYSESDIVVVLEAKALATHCTQSTTTSG